MTEAEITTMGEKGQIVIPQSLREELGIKPKMKFVVFGQGDVIVLKRLKFEDAQREWDAIFERMRSRPQLSEDEVMAEVEAVRKRRKRS